MADKFSLEDIVAEYSNKSAGSGNENDDISVDEIVEETNDEILHTSGAPLAESVTEKRESIFTAKESQAAEGKNAAVQANAVIRDEEVKSFENPAKKLFGRKSEQERVNIKELEASIRAEKERNMKRSEENAQVIESLMKLKKERGTVKKNEDVSPVSRPNVRDIDMGLTGKIIPKTEEFDKAADIPDNATYEEKSAILSQRRKKKIDSFRLKTDESEAASDSRSGNTAQREFESFDEAPAVLSDILQVKNNLVMRMCVLMFTGVFSLLITLANDFSLPLVKVFDKTMSPSAYLFTNTLMGLISIAVSYTVLSGGLKNLFKRNADCDSIAAVGILISVVSGIITLFEPSVVRENFYHVYTSAGILGLLFNTLGKLMIVKRTERNFRFAAGDYERYALVSVDNEDVAGKLTKGALNDFPELAAMRKTEFVKDFMKNSYSSDISDSFAKKTAPFILLAGLAVGLLSLIFEKGASGSAEKFFNLLAVMSGTVSMCSSLALMLVVNVPMGRAQKKFLQYSGVMLGYSSVEEFADTNSVLVDAEQLFPNGMVDFVNLKLLSSARIEDCILMAASLACQAGSVLKPTFYKMLRGKTEMLYPVESYIYEDGLGLSGWIENKRVLLGTRELMENHSIEGIPTKAKETEYAKGNIVLYLSVSGVVTTLFVVRANASLSVTRWLQELENEGIIAVVRTVDGFISVNFLSELFGVMPTSMKLLSFRFHKDFEKETEYVPEVSSSILCSGHFPSFAMLITGAKKLKFISSLGVAVQMGATVLGGVLALIMTLLGAFSQITPSLVIGYNMAFVLLTLIIQHFKRI
ncbi:hypothetical protein [Ruminococcus sp. Marseille-P6503]|uniref:hypothetical protein n=1 Tax=Ruminococcus sp. Marseille-P6503 TaxID=2364796 RepID=UPI000F535F5D|nr:hypothetical protein [Ruminococcus sp. Marseille-P6503]